MAAQMKGDRPDSITRRSVETAALHSIGLEGDIITDYGRILPKSKWGQHGQAAGSGDRIAQCKSPVSLRGE